MTITAAVDGSALGNPGPAGWAWVVSPDTWDAGGWVEATNNMGELTAVLELFRATREAGLSDEPLVILADSQYAINCITKWMPGWKKRGWKRADGKPVANREILEQIDAEIRGRRYRFEWVKGHAGHRLNELADDRAREAATAYQAGRSAVRGPGFGAAVPAAVAPSVAKENGVASGVDPSRVSAHDAHAQWWSVLDAAHTSPITITLDDGRELLLCDASRGRAILDGLEGEELPPTLF